MVKCQGQKVNYQQKDLITSNRHVKYQSSSTYYSNFINEVKVFKTLARLKDQGHNCWYPWKGLATRNTYTLKLTVQKLCAMLKFFLKVKLQGQCHKVKKCWYSQKVLVTRNTQVKHQSFRLNCSKVIRKLNV